MSFQRGFSLIEILITAFVLATVTVAITGLSLLSTRSAIRSEEKTTAEAIANKEIEIARTYTYAQVEYTDVSPEGKIERAKIVAQNNREFDVESDIELVDDPANGLLEEGTALTSETADYKKLLVKVRVKVPGGEGGAAAVVASTVVLTSQNTQADVCEPGEEYACDTEDSCEPGTPAACSDGQGNFTLDCPPIGFCSGEDSRATCPASGKCEDVDDEVDPPDLGNPSPCTNDIQCGAGAQCTNGFCEPQWCSNIPLGDFTQEVCSFDGCNDGIDNDGDGGVDVNGINWDAVNNQCLNPNLPCSPPDPECVEIAAEGRVVEWDNECIRTNPTSATDCTGEQLGTERFPKLSQCLLLKECGSKRTSRPCVVDNCQPEPSKCEENFLGCGDHQTCLMPDGVQCEDNDDCMGGYRCQLAPEGQGVVKTCQTISDSVEANPVCNNGGRWECTAESTNDPEDVVALDPDRGPGFCDNDVCQCFHGRFVQCTSSRVSINTTPDADCQQNFNNPDKPFCHFGECVECGVDAHCERLVQDGKLPAAPATTRYECRPDKTCGIVGVPQPVLPECSDGIDNDGDGASDQADPGCYTGGDIVNGSYDPNHHDERNPAPFLPTCSDGIDNDGDGLIDERDPGCHSDGNAGNPDSYLPNWPTELDPQQPPLGIPPP